MESELKSLIDQNQGILSTLETRFQALKNELSVASENQLHSLGIDLERRINIQYRDHSTTLESLLQALKRELSGAFAGRFSSFETALRKRFARFDNLQAEIKPALLAESRRLIYDLEKKMHEQLSQLRKDRSAAPSQSSDTQPLPQTREARSVQLHPKKTILRKLSEGIVFLGYIIFSHHMLLRTKTKRRVKKGLEIAHTQLVQGNITPQGMDQRLQSYLGILSHANQHTFSEALKNTYWIRPAPWE